MKRTYGVRRRGREVYNPFRALLYDWLVPRLLNLFRHGAGILLSLSMILLSIRGFFRGSQFFQVAPLVLVGVTLSVLFWRFHLTFRKGLPIASKTKPIQPELDIAMLTLALVFVCLEGGGGPSGLLYPFAYVFVAFSVAVCSKRVLFFVLPLLLVTEALIITYQPEVGGWKLLAAHTLFSFLFGSLFALLLRGEVMNRRNSMEREIECMLTSISQDAQDFRLTSGMAWDGKKLSPEELKFRRNVSSVEVIHEASYNVLAIAEHALDTHTVALYWLDVNNAKLILKEQRTHGEAELAASIEAVEGVVGAIKKKAEPIRLHSLSPGYSGLTYYAGKVSPSSFLGVPLLEHGHFRGILVADRVNSLPFSDDDLQILVTIGGEIIRAIQVERIFSDMDREKFRKEQFYKASRAFNGTLRVEDVGQVAIQAAMEVAGLEGAAMVRCLSRPDEFEIVSISWPKPRVVEALQGARFLGSGGLVAASLKARHSLPYGEICSQGQTVFAKDLSFEPSTLMILPLVWNDEPIGALLVADPRPRKLNHEVRDMLHVIADHAAIAIANGQMYQQMEELATTDGLTGLVNHRHFQELFDVGLKSAARYQRNYALILCDLDHFKSVNDTYGHPVGDAVLKRISSVLKRSARGTDIVARYGGEEFAILMDETDATGATTIAERIRNLVKQELFHSEIGSFRCSMSLGISVFPLHSSIKTELLVAADEGLYEAKRAGRDRVVLAKFPTTRKKAG